ncbi:MAG: hypothetical protein GYA57_21555 [Myxococcales bacterium]|nr:hypothetical protein [Myxococcales bacterium]
MLTKFDEWTCHQTVQTFDQVGSTDRAWTEKLWCNVHDATGGLVLATGFGVYPNRNVQDGFACVNVENRRQHNLRVSRVLRPRIDEVAVGPLRYEVLEPFRRIRLTCGDNPRGIRFDLEFRGRFAPGEEEPQVGTAFGRTFVHTCRYAQVGRAQGWIEVEGRRVEVTEDRFYAQRDHSWGQRMGVGLPEQGVQFTDIAAFRGMLILWTTLQLPDRAFTLYYIEGADGRVQRLTGHVCPRLESGAPTVPITEVQHEFRYHPRSARMSGGRLVLAAADGGRWELELQERTTMYLRGGGYTGYRGYYHGLWMGPEWQDGETFEVSDERVANEVHGLDDTVVEVRCGGEVGYGIVENLILPPFPRYGFAESEGR